MITTLKQLELQAELQDTTRSAHPFIEWFVSWSGEIARQCSLFPVLRLMLPLRTLGTDNLSSGIAYVFAANHSSHLDTAVFLAALPLPIRLRLRIAAAADYFFTSFWKGKLVRLLFNAFPFERKQPGCTASLAYAINLLKRQQSILIFPEGTRSRDGHIQQFKRGVGILSSGSHAQVVPTWIGGTFSALPKGTIWLHHQHVVVKFGRPLHFAPETDPAVIAATLEDAVRTLAE